ncbi:MAG: lipoprotein [Porticoccaceae bacterium]
MARHTHSILFGLMLATTLSVTLSGCGNKGPLYLPPAPVEQIVSPEQTADAVPTGDNTATTAESSTAESLESESSEPENTSTVDPE